MRGLPQYRANAFFDFEGETAGQAKQHRKAPESAQAAKPQTRLGHRPQAQARAQARAQAAPGSLLLAKAPRANNQLQTREGNRVVSRPSVASRVRTHDMPLGRWLCQASGHDQVDAGGVGGVVAEEKGHAHHNLGHGAQPPHRHRRNLVKRHGLRGGRGWWEGGWEQGWNRGCKHEMERGWGRAWSGAGCLGSCSPPSWRYRQDPPHNLRLAPTPGMELRSLPRPPGSACAGCGARSPRGPERSRASQSLRGARSASST